MMIVMKQDATEEQIQAVVDRIESVGARAHRSPGEEVTVIGAIGDREHVQRLELEATPGVDKVMPISKPYKLASTQIRHGEPSVFDIGGRKIGGDHFALIAGPCTVESREQTLGTAHIVKDAGGTLFRGGAYKPRTSPYAFHGLGQEGLRLLAEAKEETGLPIVTELMDEAASRALDSAVFSTTAISRSIWVDVRIPRSQSITASLPSLRMYSEALSSSSSVEESPRLSRTGRPARPSSVSSV